jgi:hypothetical protein
MHRLGRETQSERLVSLASLNFAGQCFKIRLVWLTVPEDPRVRGDPFGKDEAAGAA